jgi:hypothetical protein
MSMHQNIKIKFYSISLLEFFEGQRNKLGEIKFQRYLLDGIGK